VTDALSASERQVESLEAEIDVLQRSLSESFQIPPRVWIEERLRDFQKTLELNTGLSALILRKVLGRISLELRVPEVGHPYYLAHTKLDIVELLDPRTGNFPAHHTDLQPPADRPAGGSNALRSWRRGELKIRSRENPVRKRSNFMAFSFWPNPQNTGIYRLPSLRDARLSQRVRRR
jgi:hypothetical protein